jgi:hypothetical protein
MKDRCNNPKNQRAKRYYWRGIRVCKEWEESSEAFYEWAITHGYADGLTIDRIDNDKGYSPENCRWISNEMQQLNRCNNHLIEYHGETKTLKEWSKVFGIGYRCLLKRINELKWTPEKAFNTPTFANKSSVLRKREKVEAQTRLWDY